MYILCNLSLCCTPFYFWKEMEFSLTESLAKLEEAKKSKETADIELRSTGILAQGLREAIVHIKKLETNATVIKYNFWWLSRI